MDGFDDDFSPLQSGGSQSESKEEHAGPLRVSPATIGMVEESNRSSSNICEPREEPETIKKWKAEQLKHLEKKDKLEEEAKVALREKAKKELADWYAQHSEQLTKLQNAHRAASETAEKEFESSTHEITPGTEWERVAKLCDFNPKSARNVKDISRLRSVILQLKQGGPPPTTVKASPHHHHQQQQQQQNA